MRIAGPMHYRAGIGNGWRLRAVLRGDTRTILMDEPLANLDPHSRHTMEGELCASHEWSGVTMLFITHDQREAMAIAEIMA
jgi:iron(III) transport system ATP-binding protein